MFDYWDEGDRRWRTMPDVWLTDGECLASEWFRRIGINRFGGGSMPVNKIDPRLLQEISRKLTDEGKLIEAGWMALRYTMIPENASTLQLSEMRKAYFAGAQHLFASILSILEPGAEATDKDLMRMTQIHEELDQFVAQMKRGEA